MNSKIINIINGINEITTNKELGFVIDAINARGAIVRAMESATAKVGLSVGDTVVIKGLKRKSFNEGVITKMKRTKALVKVREPNGDRLWDCPFSMLEAV